MIKNKNYQSHWDGVYTSTEVCQLVWYESTPEPSLQLIRDCKLPRDATLLNVGAGATTLVDELMAAGFHNIIVNDISPLALEKLKQRLGSGFELQQAFGHTHTMPSGDKREYIYTLFERK